MGLAHILTVSTGQAPRESARRRLFRGACGTLGELDRAVPRITTGMPLLL
jgi:hypothetical protein